jgi:hypothetical protein
MAAEGKTVDGFRFIPPGLKKFIKGGVSEIPFSGKIPWTPLKRPVEEALSVFLKAKSPGEGFHLLFTWPREPKKTNWHPPEMSPLVRLQLYKIKQAGK